LQTNPGGQHFVGPQCLKPGLQRLVRANAVSGSASAALAIAAPAARTI
jgi:hypothetical protein